MPDRNSQQAIQYIVHHQGEALGPFDLNFIEAMVMSGVYPPSLVVENSKTKERIQFVNILPTAKISAPERTPGTLAKNPRSKEQKPSRAKSQTALIAVPSLIGVLFFVWVISLFKPDFSSSKSSATATESTPEKSYYSPTKKASSNNRDSPSERTSNSSSWYSNPPSSKRTTPSYSNPKTIVPPVDTMVYRDASGRTYSVSNADYYRLQSMKLSLSSKEVSLITEKSRLSSLATDVDVSRRMLDRTSQYEIDEFNGKVSRVNAMNSRVQSLVDDYNRDVDTFNRELERVGTPIR